MPTAAQLLEELEKSMSNMDLVIPVYKGMLYGPKGTGKSVTTAELAQAITPPDQEILWVDSGGDGWVSLRDHGLTKRMILLPYKGITALDTTALAISARAGKFAKIGTMVLDEISTMAMMDQDVVLAANAIKLKDKGKDPDVPDWPDYNANTQRMRRTVYKLLKMSNEARVHLLFVAHQREDEEKDTGIKMKRPDFMPKLSKTIGENVHVVGQMTADQEVANDSPVYKRTIQVNPSKRVDAKTRISGLGLKITPSELTQSVVGWLNGSRSTMSEDEVNAVPVVNDVPSNVKADNESDVYSGVEIT